MLNNNNVYQSSDFFLYGNAERFIDLLLQNLNRVYSGWTKGVVDATENKNLSFKDESCSRVLSRLAEEFKTEWWVEGKIIHLTKRTSYSGITLEYGKGKGLYNITRNAPDNDIYTRLYPLGGTKNLPTDYRNGSKNLRLSVDYIDKNTDVYGIIEQTKVCEDIFPKRIASITSGDFYKL